MPTLNLIPEIRNAVRAVIVRDAHLLLLKKDGGERGERYALPGGAQDPGETLAQALRRECMEEIGAPIEISALVHVADYFKQRDSDPASSRHLVEFLFECSVAADYVAANGIKPDKSQVDVVWVALAKLQTVPLYPGSLHRCLPFDAVPDTTVYLGSLD